MAVSTAERVFIFRALPNGTHETLADYQNVAPFFLNETFPPEWFRRSTAYSLVETGTDIANLLISSSEITEPGQNVRLIDLEKTIVTCTCSDSQIQEGLNNFVPLGIDLSNVTPTEATCFLASSIFDETPGFLAPGLVDNFAIVEAFLNGAVAPFFAPFNCAISGYSQPGVNASNSDAGVSTECNHLVNGIYQC